MARRRVYIAPFTGSGGAYADWIDITSDVLSLGSVTTSLDVSDYDVGVYTNSAVGITLQNSHGKYSDVDQYTSIFAYKRADTLVKITWDISNWDNAVGCDSSDLIGYEYVTFQGLLNDDSTVMQLKEQSISFQVLGLESLFGRVIGPDWASVPPSDQLVSTLIKSVLATANLGTSVALLTIDNARIIPGNDIAYDNIADGTHSFVGKLCKDILDDLLEASNSVLYLDGTTPVVCARTATATVLYHFYGPASELGAENVIDIRDVRTGINRTFNYVTWSEDGAVVKSSSNTSSIAQYGARSKDVSIDGITTGSTRQSIVDSIVAEFGSPAQELQLDAPVTYDTLALKLLDRVDIDYPVVSVSTGLPIYGQAQYGVAQYPKDVSTFFIDQSTPYKIISIETDILNNKQSFLLRRI